MSPGGGEAALDRAAPNRAAPGRVGPSADEREGERETVLYETTVVATGPLVPDFREQGIVILFDERAPEELWDLAVRHRPQTAVAGPTVGDVVEIDGTRLPVLAVGSVVAENLLRLGHLDIKADGRSAPTMPGDLCVPETDLPLPVAGSTIRLLRPGPEQPGPEQRGGGGAP